MICLSPDAYYFAAIIDRPRCASDLAERGKLKRVRPLWLSRFSFEPRIISSIDNLLVSRSRPYERDVLICLGIQPKASLRHRMITAHIC